MMMRRLLPIFFGLCACVFLNAQEMVFNSHSTKVKQFSELDYQFNAYEVFQFDIATFDHYVKNSGAYIPFQLQVGSQSAWNIALTPRYLRSADYRLTAWGDNGAESLPIGENITFKGELTDNPQGLVSLTIDEDFLYGFIKNEEDYFHIEPLWYFVPTAPKDQFVVYAASDVIPRPDAKCGADELEENMHAHSPDKVKKEEGNADMMNCWVVELAIASDASMFQQYGSVGAVQGHNIAVMNDVATNYDNEFADEIQFQIVEQFVVTGTNPWTATTNAGNYLDNFRAWGNGGGFTNSYDLGQCWTNLNISGTVIGVAYGSGLCGFSRYHLLEDFTSNANFLRVLTAHEIGHNFSCSHTAAGTIMGPSVTNTNTWAATSINQVNNFVNQVGCLSACAVIGPPIAGFTASAFSGCAPLTVNFTNQSLNSPTAWTWTFPSGSPSSSTLENPPAVTFSTPGCYNVSLVAINGAGASAPFSLTIVVNAPPVVSFTSASAGTTVVFTNNTTPNDPCLCPNSYLWNFGDGNISTDANPIHTYDLEGFYTASLTVNNCCGSNGNAAQVAAFFPPVADFAANPSAGCEGLNVEFINTSTPNVLSWNWSFQGGVPATSNSPNPFVQYLQAGTYDVTLEVCNPSGCNTIIKPDFIIVSEPPTADAGEDTAIDCNNSEVDLDGTGSSQGGNYVYNWTTNDGNIESGENSLTPTVNAAGTYCLDVIDTNGDCISSDCVEVTEDMTAPTANAVANMNLDCLNSEVELDGSGSSQGTNFSYTWDGPSIVSGGTTLSPIVNEAGIYTLTVTDDNNGCIEIAEVEVLEDTTPPFADAGENMTIDCATTVAVLDGTNSSQGSEYTYFWDGPAVLNGQTTLTPEVGEAGTYTLTVTNINNGCLESSDAIVIEDVTPPIADAGAGTSLDCSITSVFLDGTGSSQGNEFTYFWDGPAVLNGETTLTPEVGAAGTYTLTVTNINNGCLESSDVEVSENVTLPTSDAGADMALDCDSPNVTLNGTNSSQGNNFTYLWTGPNILSGETTLTPEVNEAGIYILTVTDNSNGCTASSEAEVILEAQAPTANAGSNMSVNCNTISVNLDGSGSSQGSGFSYQWTGANIISGGTTLMPEVGAGTYTLTVTNDDNGCTAVSTVEVTADNMPPAANAGAVMTLNCNNPTVTLNGSNSAQGAGITYAWTGPNILNGGTSLTPEAGEVGTYTLTVTGTNGCTATSDVDVIEDFIAPTANAGMVATLACNASSVTLNGSGSSQGGNFSYQWTGGNITSGATTLMPEVSETGIYTLTVTNAVNGCTASSEVELIAAPLPSAAIATQTNVDCHGNATGAATTEGSGGTGNYTYAWSSGGTEATETNLNAGMHTVTLTDELGCTATVEVTITEPTLLEANASATNTTAVGANDGTAIAEPIGGTSNYTYEWSTGAMTQEIIGLIPNDYTVTVTDANNCQVIHTVTVSEFDCSSVTADLSIQDANCNGSQDGEVSITLTNATTPVTYSWSSGGTEATETGLAAGTYNYTVVDGNGCEITGDAIIAAPAILEAAIVQSTNVECNGNSTGSATAEAAGGTPNYQYAWSSGGIEATENNLQAGTYTVTITDDHSCETTAEVTITEPALLATNISSTNETGIGNNDGTASSIPSGGTGLYSYLWNTGATAGTITGLAPGEYCVTVTDENNCTAENCVIVNSFVCGTLEPQITTIPVSCNGLSDGSATVEGISGATPPFTYEWSTGSTESSISNLEAATYEVTINDASGCVILGEAINVTEPDPIDIFLTELVNVECEGSSNGLATVDALGGNPDFTFEWSDGTQGPTISEVTAGTYEVTATDANECLSTQNIEIGVALDVLPPDVVTQNITVSLDENGVAVITPEMVDNGTTDNCELVSLTLDLEMLTCGNLGETTITLLGEDATGNQGSNTAIVTVLDEIAPTITCPENIVSNACETGIEYETPIAEDNCDAQVTLIEGFESGAVFPIGETLVAWEASDASGNVAICEFTITIESDLGIATEFSQPSCNGTADAAATANTTGGTEPFTYQWNDPDMQTTAVATGLEAGTYMVTVMDASGCQTIASVEIPTPEIVAIAQDEIINETNNNMNGAIAITPSGGTGNFTFNWTFNGQPYSNEEDLIGLAAGEYCVTVSDDNSCEQTDCYTIDMVNSTENPALESFITLHPNPTSSNVHLQFNLPSVSEVRIDWFDSIGRLIFTGEVETILDKTYTYDLTNVASGVYLVRMVINGEILVKKVIVE